MSNRSWLPRLVALSVFSACNDVAIELTGQADAFKVVQDGENHAVKIADLDDPSDVLARLEGWLGIPFPELQGLFAAMAEMEVDLMLPVRF